MSWSVWAAIAIALILVGGCNFAHAVGFVRGQRDMRARYQGMIDALILESAGRSRDLAQLRRECEELQSRHEALRHFAAPAANKEPV